MSAVSRARSASDPPVWLWALAVAGLVVLLALAATARERGLWGDEGTYLAMAASLVRDGDLRFEAPDAEWARGHRPEQPATVILQRTQAGVTYSKPALHPLLAAPFFAVLGERGLIALNLLATLAAFWIAWRLLRRLGPARPAALTLVTFGACSVLPFYLGWRMSDSLQVACCLAGLSLVVGGLRAEAGRRALVAAAVGGLLLGLAAVMRYPGAALALAPVAGGLWSGRWRRSLVVALAAVVGFAAAAGAGSLLAGTSNPYKAERASFSGATGYPVSVDAPEAGRFSTHPATQSAGLLPRLDWTRSGYSALYYLVGRHTGVLLYFPAVLALLAAILGRPDRLALALVAGVAAVVLFYLLWMPENYYGGSTFVGNRYFLAAYPALLAALPRLPSSRWLAVAWLIGLAAGGSALLAARAGDAGRSGQGHTTAGLFRLLPSETTAQKVDGFRARYWSRDFVRFTDHFADVGEDAFRLATGSPPAGLEVAFRKPRADLHLLVASAVPGARLHWRDWAGGGSVELQQGRQLVELRLSAAWRWHTYWWRAADVYQVRALRLAVDEPSGRGSEVEIRYLGDGAEARVPLLARRASLTVDGRLVGGSRSRLRLRARNAGRGPWPHAGVLPVSVRLTLSPEEGESETWEILQALPEDVAPGGQLDMEIDVPWPARAGRYRVAAELVRTALPEAGVAVAGRSVLVLPPPGGGGPDG